MAPPSPSGFEVVEEQHGRVVRQPDAVGVAVAERRIAGFARGRFTVRGGAVVLFGGGGLGFAARRRGFAARRRGLAAARGCAASRSRARGRGAAGGRRRAHPRRRALVRRSVVRWRARRKHEESGQRPSQAAMHAPRIRRVTPSQVACDEPPRRTSMSYRSSFVLPYRDRRVTGRHAKCSKFQRYPLCMANASMTLLVWTLVLWSVDASDASTGEFANDGTASVATDEASDSGDASGSDTDGTDTDGADTHGSGTGDDDSGGTTDEATTGFVTIGFVTSGATSSNDSSDSCGVNCSNVPPEFRDLEDGAIVRSPL